MSPYFQLFVFNPSCLSASFFISFSSTSVITISIFVSVSQFFSLLPPSLLSIFTVCVCKSFLSLSVFVAKSILNQCFFLPPFLLSVSSLSSLSVSVSLFFLYLPLWQSLFQIWHLRPLTFLFTPLFYILLLALLTLSKITKMLFTTNNNKYPHTKVLMKSSSKGGSIGNMSAWGPRNMSLNLSKGDNLFLKRMIIVSCNSCCLVKAGANTYFYRDLKSPFIKTWCTEYILNFFQSYFFYFFYYRDHWDPGFFTCYTHLLN